MALTASYQPKYSGGAIVGVVGSATTDSTAFLSQSGNTTAASATINSVAATAGFVIADIVRVTGAVQKFVGAIKTVTANTSLALYDGYSTSTTEAVTVTLMTELPFYFDAPFRATQIEWHDETNGITWAWYENMPIGSAWKRVWSTGVQTLQTGVGLVLFQNKLCVAPDVAPVSSTFRFAVA